jgi:hypothetical protein
MCKVFVKIYRAQNKKKQFKFKFKPLKNLTICWVFLREKKRCYIRKNQDAEMQKTILVFYFLHTLGVTLLRVDNQIYFFSNYTHAGRIDTQKVSSTKKKSIF